MCSLTYLNVYFCVMKEILLVLVMCVSVVKAQTVILNEEFDAGIPLDWTVVDNDNNVVDNAVSEYNDAWIAKIDPDDTNNSVASATSFFAPIDRADRWLITEAVDLGSFGNTVSWKTKSHDPSYTEDYSVLISSTDTQLSSFTDTIALVTDATPFWAEYSVNLSDLGFNGGTVYLAFVLTTFDGFKIYLDDVEINKEDPVSTENELSSISNLSVYPNPFSDILEVVYSENLPYSIRDTHGRLVKEGITNVEMDVVDLNEGVYFIHLIRQGITLKHRMIKL